MTFLESVLIPGPPAPPTAPGAVSHIAQRISRVPQQKTGTGHVTGFWIDPPKKNVASAGVAFQESALIPGPPAPPTTPGAVSHVAQRMTRVPQQKTGTGQVTGFWITPPKKMSRQQGSQGSLSGKRAHSRPPCFANRARSRASRRTTHHACSATVIGSNDQGYMSFEGGCVHVVARAPPPSLRAPPTLPVLLALSPRGSRVLYSGHLSVLLGAHACCITGIRLCS